MSAFVTYRGEDRIFLVAYFNHDITGQIIGPPTMTDQEAIAQILDEHERVPLGHLGICAPYEWSCFIRRSRIVRYGIINPGVISPPPAPRCYAFGDRPG